MKNVYKFVQWDVSELETLSNSSAYQLLEKLNRGEALTCSEKTGGIFLELSNSETYNTGKYRLGGYIFDFSPYMKTFLVQYKYYGWQEIKAFDKTSVRKNATFPSYILRIIELTEKNICTQRLQKNDENL